MLKGAKQITLAVLLCVAAAAGLGVVLFQYAGPGKDSLPVYTAEEAAWLRAHRGGLEVLFGYQAPPNAYTDADGDYVGLLVDYFHVIERNLGLRIRTRDFGTWNELLEYSKTHRGFLIVGVAETEARREYLRFTEPFMKIPYVIVTRAGSGVRGMSDLAGRVVSTVRNYAVNDYLRERHPGIRVSEAEDNLAGLLDVAAGRSEAMIIDQAYASYYIESQGLGGLRVVGESGYNNYLSAACSSADRTLQDILRAAVAAIPDSRHRELFRKWVRPESGYVHLSRGSVRLLWILGGLALLGACAVWFLIHSLRATVRRQTVTIRRDYERLKEAERSLRDKERSLNEALARLTFHVRNSPLGVVEWNRRGRISDWSPRAEALFGWRLEQVLGRSWDDPKFVHPEDLPRVREQVAPLFSGGLSQAVCENRNRASDGSVLHCRWYYSALRNAAGEVLSILALAEDITGGKLAERQLIRAKEAAEAANGAKSEFLANMSHEIRTPLNGIQGMLQILQTTGLDRDQELYVDKALDSTRRLTRLLSDILDLSRLESGRLVLSEEPFDPRELLESIRALFAPTAEEKGLELAVECGADVPATLSGDPARLRQILLNLTGNALKFTGRGGRVGLSLSRLPARREDDFRLLYFVGDSGSGMTGEQVASLVEPFVPGEASYRRTYEGAGLGLAVVVRLVRLMRGGLCIASAPGEGTEVACDIPMPLHEH